MQKYVSVIGGINLDIKGISNITDAKADSNIGKTHFTPGGVARNVAENLSRLKIPTNLIGCIGNDDNGQLILKNAEQNGINTEHVLISSEINTSVYLSISNKEGSLVSAVNDMKDSLNLVSVDYLKEKAELIKNSKVIFADTNLNKDALQYIITIANENKIPVFIDTVSIEKSNVIKDLTGEINFLSPNLNEFNNLFGEFDMDRITWKMDSPIFKKFKSIILKRGEKGIVLINIEQQKIKLFSPMKIEVAEPNGAGDAFNAGFIYGLMYAYDEYDSIQLGICAAYYALISTHSVSEKLTEENLLNLYRQKSKNEF